MTAHCSLKWPEDIESHVVNYVLSDRRMKFDIMLCVKFQNIT